MTYNYSIIIPHKNIPDLLERCLASIPRRDDTQIIVVDDSSDPGIVDFSRFPGKGRPDVEVIFHRSPIGGAGGAGYARNRGIEEARGKWLVFADADDFFHPALSEAMDRYADLHDADMIFFRHDSVDSETLAPVSINTTRNRRLAEFDRASGESISGGGMVGGGVAGETEDEVRYKIPIPWARFISREMVLSHNIRFDEVRFSGNLVFCLKVGYFAGKIISDPAVVYCNVRREGSLIHEGRRDWAAMSERFDVDYRAALFAASVGKGRLFEGVVADRWRELARIDRRKARGLLPRLREVCSPDRVRRARLAETLRRAFTFFAKKQ